jgi:MerR family copper efflux transcriptional regulator
MLIQEFSKRTGWTRDTIRFYERLGLLQPVRGRGNGYRHYTEAEVEVAEQVKMAQTLGFSLTEIKQGVGAYRTGAMTASLEDAMMEQKLAQVELQLERLRRVKEYLVKKRAWLRGGRVGEKPEWREG